MKVNFFSRECLTSNSCNISKARLLLRAPAVAWWLIGENIFSLKFFCSHNFENLVNFFTLFLNSFISRLITNFQHNRKSIVWKKKVIPSQKNLLARLFDDCQLLTFFFFFFLFFCETCDVTGLKLESERVKSFRMENGRKKN